MPQSREIQRVELSYIRTEVICILVHFFVVSLQEQINTMSFLSTLTTDINSALASLATESCQTDEGDRMAAFQACQLLIAELQGPREALLDITLTVCS